MTLPEIEKLLQESRKTGRPIEMFDLYGWRPIQENENMSPTLRIAPPQEPREWWIDNGSVIEVGTGKDAMCFASGCIRVRELTKPSEIGRAI